MDFDEEWAAHKSVAARSMEQNNMRLNGADARGGSGGADLKTSSAAKDGAANALRDHIRPAVRTTGGHTDDESATAVSEFAGWQTGAGLKEAYEEWERQVANLQARLTKEENGLRSTKRDFQYVDHEVERPLSRIAMLGADAGDHRHM
ncbi:hypothetical protein ACFC0C_07380 [Streptomyces sp. NPDC056178]|uniref:hypothetical protein n=1 Tax=Streptomyces sp. NPDC056178 TaxID=3345735 RepID=UPI0035D6D9CB